MLQVNVSEESITVLQFSRTVQFNVLWCTAHEVLYFFGSCLNESTRFFKSPSNGTVLFPNGILCPNSNWTFSILDKESLLWASGTRRFDIYNFGNSYKDDSTSILHDVVMICNNKMRQQISGVQLRCHLRSSMWTADLRNYMLVPIVLCDCNLSVHAAFSTCQLWWDHISVSIPVLPAWIPQDMLFWATM